VQSIRWFRDAYLARASVEAKRWTRLRSALTSSTWLLATATLGIVVVSCTCISLILELNAIRRNEVVAAAEFQNGVFSRVDSLLWKADTFLTIASATNKGLGAGLTQVRVQVKESTDAQTQSTAAMSKAATTAVKASLAATGAISTGHPARGPSTYVTALQLRMYTRVGTLVTDGHTIHLGPEESEA